MTTATITETQRQRVSATNLHTACTCLDTDGRCSGQLCRELAGLAAYLIHDECGGIVRQLRFITM